MAEVWSFTVCGKKSREKNKLPFLKNNSGSLSRKKFRIRPDPQHWYLHWSVSTLFYQYFFRGQREGGGAESWWWAYLPDAWAYSGCLHKKHSPSQINWASTPTPPPSRSSSLCVLHPLGFLISHPEKSEHFWFGPRLLFASIAHVGTYTFIF